MLLRVIKERYYEDGTPMIDPTSGAARRQFVNGGQVRVLDPKTRLPRTYLPGEVIDLPDAEARDLLLNAPSSVEPEERYQAREAARKSRDKSRESERDALDARMAELGREVEQAQKLRAMAEQRERERAAENMRVSQVSTGKDALLEEMKRQIAALEARLSQADKTAESTSEGSAESKQGRKKASP